MAYLLLQPVLVREVKLIHLTEALILAPDNIKIVDIEICLFQLINLFAAGEINAHDDVEVSVVFLQIVNKLELGE